MQPTKTSLDDNLANEGKIGRWSSQWRQNRTMLELYTIYCLAM